MSNWEIPLVLLTVLTQWAVGIALMLTLIEFLYPQVIAGNSRGMIRLGGMMTFPLITIAVLSSMTHLGQPLNAINAFRHLGTSWLSMETLFSVVMGLLSAFYCFIWWKKPDHTSLRKTVGLVLALVGIGAVLVSSQVYMLLARSAWNNWTTPAAFMLTALMLGSFSALYMLSKSDKEDPKAKKFFAILAIAAIALVVCVLSGSVNLGSNEQIAVVVATFSSPLFYLRLVVGLMLPLICAVKPLMSEKAYANAVALGLVCTLVGEIVGRMLFYSSTLNQAPWF